MTVNLLDQPTPEQPQWFVIRGLKPGVYPQCFRCRMGLGIGDTVTTWHGQTICERCHAWEHAADAPPALVVPPAVELAADDRDEAIALIRRYLRERSGKTWSVTGDRGTAWGWIKISSPPARRTHREHGGSGYLSAADAAELGKLLGMDRPVHPQGQNIAAGRDYRREYIDRAAGRAPTEFGHQYWD